MKIAKINLKQVAFAALVFAPLLSQAAPVRMPTFDEESVEKVQRVMTKSELKYVVTNGVCGTSKPGSTVKVVIKSASGKFVLLRTYGVPENGILFDSKPVLCQ